MRSRRIIFLVVMIAALVLAPAMVSAQEQKPKPAVPEAQSPEAPPQDPGLMVIEQTEIELGATAEATVEGPVEGMVATAAEDVAAGTFGGNTGGGNYAFPANVGVGTSTPISRIHLLNGGILQETNLDSAASFASVFYKSRGTTAAKTIVALNDQLGFFRFAGYDGTSFKNSAMIAAYVDAAPGANDMPSRLVFFTANDGAATLTERMRISSAGNIGIGTSNPSYKLHVVGNAHVAGTLTGTNIAAQYQDIAEWVPSTIDVRPGTVVVLNPEKSNEVMPSVSAYDTRVAGVVSEQPGLTLGIAADTKEMVATTGRVHVLVDASKEPIRIGDLLVTSDRAGYAMKSVPMDFNGRSIHQPGTIVGKALENIESGEGSILVLLSLQ